MNPLTVTMATTTTVAVASSSTTTTTRTVATATAAATTTIIPSSMYVSALSKFFLQWYGLELTNSLLLRIFYVEKTLKWHGYETINTNEYFFLIYYVFINIHKYFVDTIYREPVYRILTPFDIMDLTLYFVYSYCGPTVEYRFNFFIMGQRRQIHINWKAIILDIVCNTDLPQKLLKLNMDEQFLTEEIQFFLYKNIL